MIGFLAFTSFALSVYLSFRLFTAESEITWLKKAYRAARDRSSDALQAANRSELKLASHKNRINQLVERHHKLRQSNAILHRDFARALYQKGRKDGKKEAKASRN